MDFLPLFLLVVFGVYGVATRFLLVVYRLRLGLRDRPGGQSSFWFWYAHLLFGWGPTLGFLVAALVSGGGPALWLYGFFLPVPGLVWLIIDQGLDLVRNRRALDAVEHKDERVPALLAALDRIAQDHGTGAPRAAWRFW